MSRQPWRAATRIAYRDSWRHRGRSLLVIAMIAVPVAGVAAADVLVRTAQLSPQQQATRSLGQADALAIAVAHGPIIQKGSDQFATPPGTARNYEPMISRAQLRALMPPGTSTVSGRASRTGIVSVGNRSVVSDIGHFDYANALVRGVYTQHSGRAPTSPDEGALTTRLAHELGVSTGDMVQVRVDTTTTPMHVVGTIDMSSSHNIEQILLPPTAASEATTQDPATMFIGYAPGTDVTALQHRLNRHGVVLDPRSAYERGTTLSAFQRSFHAGVVLIVIGLAAFEVVLLAGAAFAVGARRQRRELALIATAGASPPHVGAVVLAQGFVLGAAGGVVGAALGVLLGVLLRGPVQQHTNLLFGPLDIRPLEIAVVAVLGIVTGLLAAAVPALGATRLNVVDCLNGRRGTVRTSGRFTLLGALAAGGGIAIAAYGARTGLPQGSIGLATNGSASLPAPTTHFSLILAGTLIAEIGLVACVSALLGAAGRLGRWLPPAARLGLRDVSRQRGRSAPAVAAIMAALAGAVALSTYLVSSDAHDRREFEPTVRPGQAMVSDKLSPGRIRAVAAQLPTRRVATLNYAVPRCHEAGGCDQVTVSLPKAARCPVVHTTVTVSEIRRLAKDPRCTGAGLASGVAIGGADIVAVSLGHPDAGATAALARGEAVALQPRYVSNDAVTLLVTDSRGTHRQRVPVHVTPALNTSLLPAVVLPPTLAASIGLRPQFEATIFDTIRTPTASERAQAQSLLSFGALNVLYVQSGFTPVRTLDLVALVAVAAFITITSVAVATGLAAAEGEPDLATLGAIGASPRTRRVVVGVQAGSVGLLGAALGLVAGVVPAWALVHAQVLWTLHLPWRLFAVAVVGVPVLGALLAASFSRSRLPMRARSA